MHLSQQTSVSVPIICAAGGGPLQIAAWERMAVPLAPAMSTHLLDLGDLRLPGNELLQLR
jgi:hypothetical protein